MKSAKMIYSNIKSMFLINISLLVKCSMLHCQWSLQLSVTSATSYMIFFSEHFTLLCFYWKWIQVSVAGKPLCYDCN